MPERVSPALTRRGMLAALAAGGVASAVPAAAAMPRTFFRRYGLPLGIQLYTVAAEANKDPDGTLQALARIGYRTVETAGYLGLTPGELRVKLERAGLTCTSAHIQPLPLRPGPSLMDDPAQLAEQAHAIGFDTIIMPSFLIPSRLELKPRAGEDAAAMFARIAQTITLDEWKRNADFLNEKAAGLKRVGLKLGYHNHNNEFAPLPGGGNLMRMLLERTDPGLVTFEMDVGWVVAAGQDPLQWLHDYPHRFTAMHVKDVKATTKPNFLFRQDPAEVGAGIIDWKRILPVAYRAGVHRFFVEQEAPFTMPPLQAVAKSHDYLMQLKG